MEVLPKCRFQSVKNLFLQRNQILIHTFIEAYTSHDQWDVNKHSSSKYLYIKNRTDFKCHPLISHPLVCSMPFIMLTFEHVEVLGIHIVLEKMLKVHFMIILSVKISDNPSWKLENVATTFYKKISTVTKALFYLIAGLIAGKMRHKICNFFTLDNNYIFMEK